MWEKVNKPVQNYQLVQCNFVIVWVKQRCFNLALVARRGLESIFEKNKFLFPPNKTLGNSSHSIVASQDAVERAQQMKRELLERLDRLAEDLPPNTLDELIDELGGPDNVAEVSVKRTMWSRACTCN